MRMRPTFPLRRWRPGLVVVALVASACGDESPLGPEETDAAPPSFEIDTSIRPAVAELPGFDGQAPRPVASVVDDDGHQADFVENELWLASNDRAQLATFLDRWDGEVVSSIETGGTALEGLPNQYLVRVSAPLADLDAFVDDLTALDPNSSGAHRVSSEGGLALLAAGAAEAARGLSVGVNWVGRGAGAFRDEQTLEAPGGPSGYDPDVFNWPTHRLGGNQDIGVTAAWRVLDLAGKLNNKIDVAILDMGFQDDADWPAGWSARSNVPFVNPIGSDNLLSCGGSPCPWHGTNVFSAAMAVPDNGYGSAGPAGPVADPTVVYTSYDFFTSIGALAMSGSDVVNMSYGAPVPTVLAWSVLQFDAATALYRAAGNLIFASAGNDGDDIDAQRCVGGLGLEACWEKTWYTPCENSGVICVGGLAWDSKLKAANSNYGAEHVDVYAPYTLWLGPDPANPGNSGQTLNGTSFSSPFAAGVAALIWAADPDLGADEVERALYETAHTSPDPDVKRYVNAYGAVLSVIGNVPPDVEIVSPDHGATRQVNTPVRFHASVSDVEDAQCCTLSWFSMVDGALGAGLSINPTFQTLGVRRIAVTGVDAGGATGTASIRIRVVNTPPSPQMAKPTPGEQIFRTTSYVLRGSAVDPNESGAQLPCSALTWTSSASDAAFPVTGCDPEVVFTTNGSRTLTLTAKDSHGGVASKTVSVTVVDPPPNLPPRVQVLSPPNPAVNIGASTELTLEGSAVDPEGGTPLAYEWFVVHPYDPGSGTGQNTTRIGSGRTRTWKPSDTIPINCDTYYLIRIELRATDAQGNTGVDFVIGEVEYIC